MSEDPTLLPCPLCSGQAFLKANWYATHLHIYCASCGLFTREVAIGLKAEAIEAWNRRAPVEITEEMVSRATATMSRLFSEAKDTSTDGQVPNLWLVKGILDAALKTP